MLKWRQLVLYVCKSHLCSKGLCDRAPVTVQDAAESFKYPETITSVSFTLRKAYSQLLWDFEQIYYFQVSQTLPPNRCLPRWHPGDDWSTDNVACIETRNFCVHGADSVNSRRPMAQGWLLLEQHLQPQLPPLPAAAASLASLATVVIPFHFLTVLSACPALLVRCSGHHVCLQILTTRRKACATFCACGGAAVRAQIL